MKNRIFLLLLCLLAASIMTANDGLYFPEGSKWKLAITAEDSYIVQGDTIVESKTYQKVVHKIVDKLTEQDEEKLVALKREEGKKIYVRFEGTDTDVLLYDFGLEVGDSIVQHAEEFGFSWCQGPCTYHVEYIDTVTLLDGRKAKLIMYDGRMGDIEYVGCVTGLFGPITMPDIPTGDYHYSYCFSIKGKPIYETFQGICRSCGYVNKLPSLCDEWNVLNRYLSGGMINIYHHTYTYKLQGDTTIGGRNYVKLGNYKGAFREGDNRDIYYVPEGLTQEFLMYAFNAKEGDTFDHVWIGGAPDWSPNGHKVTIKEIRETNPRTFLLDVIKDGTSNHWEYSWIEGVGMPQGPDGDWCPFDCAGDGSDQVLCAYKNGELMYVSEMGEEYGCEYNAEPIDISLYHAPDLDEWDGQTGVNQASRDTLMTIDKKQMKAVLSGHHLYVWIVAGDTEIKLFSLADQSNVYSSVFNYGDFAEDIHLQTPGSYMLVLKTESFGGLVIGRVDFETDPQDIRHITIPSSVNASKYIRNGRFVIERDGKIYDATGAEVR